MPVGPLPERVDRDQQVPARSGELEELSDTAGRLHSFVRRSDVTEHEVVRFIERRILDSPLLTPGSARSIGR
ncbi:hypothetical protein ACQP1V_27300 [Microtetraspora malaysiensis]|uniref:hypothetical protein n=1 Tax=Microtetraspora malaysiensis TaxID=161358 RepID=UPI003D933EF4